MQIELKMEAGDCPTLNMNAMENYLLSQSLIYHVSLSIEELTSFCLVLASYSKEMETTNYLVALELFSQLKSSSLIYTDSPRQEPVTQ